MPTGIYKHPPQCGFQKGHQVNKGHIPWNKGTKGFIKPNSGSFKKGIIPWMTGRKHTEETKQKNSLFHKGLKLSKETKRKMSLAHKGMRGNKSSSWKGGKIKNAYGYTLIYSPKHPFRNTISYVFEQRLVMEKHIGRYLKPSERVHHINKNPSDNRINNLMLFKNISYHMWFHKKGFCNPKGIIFHF